MREDYGITTARQAIIKLINEGATFRERLGNAISELTVIEEEDVSKQHFAEIQVLQNKYLDLDKSFVHEDGSIEKPDSLKIIKDLSEKMIWLAFEICEKNSRRR